MSDMFNIPFSLKGIPVGNFVGRNEQLRQIEQCLQPTSLAEKSRRKVFVIRGLGGMGKTKLAAEYTRLHQDKYSAIFWLDGSTKGRLHQSFLELAKHISDGPLREEAAAASKGTVPNLQYAMTGVLLWLSLPDNWKWLLVIDNVDREFRNPGKDEQGFDPEEAMPRADHGSILITSRLRSLKGTGTDLQLRRMEENEAEEILIHHAGRPLRGWSLFHTTLIRLLTLLLAL
jgi:hypothetical protein